MLALAVTACFGAPERKAAASPGASAAFGEQFARHWHDGRAELAGYDLWFPRYGELRRGTSVAIFVTEPFDSKRHIKPEDPKRGDTEVIKLNLVQDFATGIYDYNLMTSAFVATRATGKRPPGSILKISFSAQEWCGHVYAQARFSTRGVRFDSHSYFEGEGDERRELSYPGELGSPVLSEDALLLWARGLAGPNVVAGGLVVVPLLRSLAHVRLSHTALSWERAELSQEATPQTIEVPAGRFEVMQRHATLRRDGGGETRWDFAVEKAYPHRIVRFARDDGLRAELTGSTRVPYWQLNGNGKQALLSRLGLRPRPVRTP